jgi:hypothetical protein
VNPALNDLVLGPQFLLSHMENKISLSEFGNWGISLRPQFLLGQTQKGNSLSENGFGIKAPPSGSFSALPHRTPAMASDSGSSNGSDSSIASSTEWTQNEGESSENDEETPADPSLRGTTFLVTVACPRNYTSELEARKARRIMLPEDFSKEDLLKKFRRVFNTQSKPRTNPKQTQPNPKQAQNYCKQPKATNTQSNTEPTQSRPNQAQPEPKAAPKQPKPTNLKQTQSNTQSVGIFSSRQMSTTP